MIIPPSRGSRVQWCFNKGLYMFEETLLSKSADVCALSVCDCSYMGRRRLHHRHSGDGVHALHGTHWVGRDVIGVQLIFYFW